jgi:hypothetical protein
MGVVVRLRGRAVRVGADERGYYVAGSRASLQCYREKTRVLRYNPGQLWNIVIVLTATSLLAATVTSAAAQAVQSPLARKVISIAEARALPPGTVVTIAGVVTVPSGSFKASSDDEGFALQDSSGGIYVSLHVELGLRAGRRVRVTGKLTELNGLLVIQPPDAKSIAAHGRGPLVQPAMVATSKINEQTLGRPVQATGTITGPVGSDGRAGYIEPPLYR